MTPFNKKVFYIIFFLILAFTGYKFSAYLGVFSRNLAGIENTEKTIFINDTGLNFISKTQSQTVGDWLTENKIVLGEQDKIIPGAENKIFSGMNLQIKRAFKIKIEVDGKTLDTYTLQNNIADALSENNVVLGRLDKVEPDKNFLPQKNLKIIVTRINVEEKVIPEDIDFPVVTKNDNKLGWREEKIQEPGIKGIREVKYKITYKNGKEVSRVVLEKNITQKPVTQIVVKGTYMELGKAAKGQGTWYAFKGGLFAASTSIPRGGYAKVTNTANGKSVVVQINDYGPQGKGRIIDLDKVAFQKIAPIGAGVIGVKVEEILN
jgi:hypothetical protein